MLSADSNSIFDFDEQFNSKIKYNFRLHVLVCLKGSNWNRQDILKKIYSLVGYRCHKVVKYGTNWSHIHIKFTGEEEAKYAVDTFKNSDLSAILVDSLLKDWYTFELRSNYSPPWCLAIIDVVGSTPKSMNFLTENLLNSILYDFGGAYMLPYTAALHEIHAQMLFSSMTEALAACMSFGQWYRMNQKTDQFYYRVRISPCSKESILIKNSGGIPEEAFGLDYFVNERKGTNPSASTCKQIGSFQRNSRNNYFRRDTQKNLCQNYIPDKSRSHRSDISQVNFRTPVICIPVIAPMNNSSRAQALVAPDRDTSEDGSDVGLRLQKECFEVVKNRVEALTEVQVYSSQNRGKSDTLFRASIQSTSKYTEQTASDPLRNCIEVSSSFQPISTQTIPRPFRQNFSGRNAPAFERRK